MPNESSKLLGGRALSRREQEIILHARRRGGPFLLYERWDGGTRKLCLERLSGRTAVHLGRAEENEIVIGWDARVGRVHSKLECHAGVWYVQDLDSKNGTFVDDKRISEAHRLRHHETFKLCAGANAPRFLFCAVGEADRSTVTADSLPKLHLTPREQELIAAVCVHHLCGTGDEPATDKEMESLLNKTGQAIRRGLSPVYAKLGLTEVSQGRKRRRLFEIATRYALAKPADLPIDCADVANRLAASERGARKVGQRAT